jgi:outer membrane protein assembly factor BamB
MKLKKLFTILTLVLAVGLLSACAMGPRVATIPGIAATEDAVYVSYGPYLYKATGFESEKLSEAWRYPEKGSQSMQINAPVLVDGENLIVGDFAKVLRTINAESGQERNAFTGASGWYQVQAVRAKDLIIVPNNDKSIYAVRDNGEIAWTYTSSFAYLDHVVVANDLVYVSCQDKRLIALDLDTGTEKWVAAFDGALPAAPLYDEGMQTLFVGGLSRSVSAVDALTGKILWSSNADGKMASVWGTPVIVNGSLVVSDEKGQIFGMDPKTGAVQWVIEGSGKMMAGPLAIEDGIVVVTEDGTVKAYKDGALKPSWTQSIAYTDKKDIQVFTTPVLAGDTIIVAAQMDRNANVLLIGIDQNGNLQFTFTPEK